MGHGPRATSWAGDLGPPLRHHYSCEMYDTPHPSTSHECYTLAGSHSRHTPRHTLSLFIPFHPFPSPLHDCLTPRHSQSHRHRQTPGSPSALTQPAIIPYLSHPQPVPRSSTGKTLPKCCASNSAKPCITRIIESRSAIVEPRD